MARKSDLISKENNSILDIGCGNGVTCIQLSCDGYANVTGVDYSDAAIQLCKKIAEKRKIENVTFDVSQVIFFIQN